MDRLGRELSEGLAPLRSARPSEDVWFRIARSTHETPKGPVRALAIWIAGHIGKSTDFVTKVAFNGAVAAVVAIGCISGATVLVSEAGTPVVSRSTIHPSGLSQAEAALQPAVAPRAYDQRVAPGAASPRVWWLGWTAQHRMHRAALVSYPGCDVFDLRRDIDGQGDWPVMDSAPADLDGGACPVHGRPGDRVAPLGPRDSRGEAFL